MPLGFHHHMATAIETEQRPRPSDEAYRRGGRAALRCRSHALRRRRRAARHRQARPRASSTSTPRTCADPVHRAARPRTAILPRRGARRRLHRPGDGVDRLHALVIQRLADVGYEGWFVVEAEQDPAKAPPAEYARIGYRALTAALAKAGYRIEDRSVMTQMEGKIAVVTGGTQGLGASVAALFAERGASGIVICGRSREKGEAKAREIQAGDRRERRVRAGRPRQGRGLPGRHRQGRRRVRTRRRPCQCGGDHRPRHDPRHVTRTLRHDVRRQRPRPRSS